MKMRLVKLSPDFLMKAVQGKTSGFPVNLPDDTELLDIKYDLFSRQVTAVVRSDSFEDLAETYPIPELNLTYSATQTTPTQPTPTLTPEPKPAAALKPEPKLTPLLRPEPSKRPQPNLYTSKMEEEFSPEQRRLLSFKVEGDSVVVKPTQFLKAEWDDINDVVKSLGGKWVKGGIISYWVIPLP
jgi:hypothetical protein